MCISKNSPVTIMQAGWRLLEATLNQPFMVGNAEEPLGEAGFKKGQTARRKGTEERKVGGEVKMKTNFVSGWLWLCKIILYVSPGSSIGKSKENPPSIRTILAQEGC